MSVNKESEYKEIKEFLNRLESISGQVSELEISEKIKNFAEKRFENNYPNSLLWEKMAFDFVENYPDDKSEWNTYFGSMYVLPNKEGKMLVYPSIRKITPEILSYWEKRAKESKNPVFKQRYSNLVWDFSEKITSRKPNYSIAQIFIDSVIEIAEEDLHKYEVDVIRKLERALSLGLSIKDKKRIDKLIDTIISYERKIAEDDKLGLWGFSYEYLVKNKKVPLTEDKKNNIISDLEKRFARLLDNNNHWAAQEAALLLLDYYSKLGSKEKIKETLIKLGEMIQKQAEKTSPLVASDWLEQLYHLYLQYGIKDEADRISNKIRELGKQTKSEFKKIETSLEIPKNELEEYIKWLTDGDLDSVLKKIAVNYIPRKDEVVEQIRDLSKKAPISFLITRKIFDTDGRLIATVGPLKEDMDGHIVLRISKNMQISSFFLRETLIILIDKFSLTASKIVNYLYKSPIFEEKRRDFLIRGIEAFLDGDFLVSMHILIPQIEAIIRNLAEKIGIPILKPSRSGGFFYRTLDELLREEGIIRVLSEDMCLYFRVLLTDQRGWNIRNDVCHGISGPENFNQMVADRIFHVLLCLALVKERKKKEE